MTGLVRDHFPGPALVILDDIWEGESVGAARTLAAAAPPGSVHLITTRSQVVVAQLRSTGLELRPMEPGDAIQMLRNLLSGHPEVSETDLRELAEIVGHHPLAMELAAGQVQLLERPAEDIHELIARYRGGIPAGSPFRHISLELGEAREDNLELVLSYSYASLDPPDQARFRALGVLAYGADFDQSLCRAIWNDEPKPVLDRLRHRNLLSLASERGWYRQHQLLRSYGRALLHSHDHGRHQVEERYVDCVVDISTQFAERASRDWLGLDPYLAHVEEVGALLVAAIDAAEPEPHTAQQALSFALRTRHLLAARRELDHPEWLHAGVTASRHCSDPGNEVLLLNEISLYQRFRGDATAAIRSVYDAEQLASKIGDTAGIARSTGNIGSLMMLQDPDSAPKWFHRSVQLYVELDDPPGLSNTLLLLAEWQANWYRTFEERTEAIATLTRVLNLCTEHGLPDVAAEARLQLGRLYDTLAEPAAADPLLREVMKQFQELLRKDREGLARLFLADMLAANDELVDAQAHLQAAVSLFATTGYRVGHAVALRNLAQLYATDGRREAALEAYAAAIPLTWNETDRFLDEDEFDLSVARGYFTAQLEEVAKLDQVEQFRARGLAQLDKAPATGTLPEDMLGFLLTETIRAAASSTPADDWVAALERLAVVADEDFVLALQDIALGRSVTLDEANSYARIVSEVQRRVHTAAVLLPDDVVQEYAQKTVAARVFQPEHRQTWARTLRVNLRGSRLWAEEEAEAYFRGLLAILLGRPAALPRDNPYRDALESVLNTLFKYERLPTDVILEQTVIVRTVLPGNLDRWLDNLRVARRNVAQLGDRSAVAFINAMIALAKGEVPNLPDTNPFHADLGKAVEAIAAGTLLILALPSPVLANLAAAVVEARTSQPKTMDELIERLADSGAEALSFGRYLDADLYEACAAIVNGQAPAMPAGHAYKHVIDFILEEIGDRQPESCANQTIPEPMLDRLVTAALSGTPQARAYLEHHRASLSTRGHDWAKEASFVQTLIDLIDGNETSLPDANPYAPQVRTIHQRRLLRAVGGKLTVEQLEILLSDTARVLRGRHDTFFSLTQGEWENHLMPWRTELALRGPAWKHEVALLDALIALVKFAPGAELTPDNPYFEVFQKVATNPQDF